MEIVAYSFYWRFNNVNNSWALLMNVYNISLLIQVIIVALME